MAFFSRRILDGTYVKRQALLLSTHVVSSANDLAIFGDYTCTDRRTAFLNGLLSLFDSGQIAGVLVSHGNECTEY